MIFGILIFKSRVIRNSIYQKRVIYYHTPTVHVLKSWYISVYRYGSVYIAGTLLYPKGQLKTWGQI